MKMNKNKPKYRFTYNYNLQGNCNMDVIVHASTYSKARKMADAVMKSNPDVFFYIMTGYAMES